MKIKKIISGISAALVLIGGVPVFSGNPVQDYSVTVSAADYTKGTYENFTYRKYSDHIEIEGCDNSAISVVIPAEIEELPVTVIRSWAFEYHSNLESITIPDSVTSIGASAFSECSSLKSITIPNGVTRIYGNTFFGCHGLTSIIIPDGVTSIGDSAFNGCLNLESITIPDSVTSIGNWAFLSCSNLESIIIPDSITSIGADVFYDTPWLKAKQKENPLVVVSNILIDGKTCEGDVVIPDSVTSISATAFGGCESLTSITIPDSVTSIGTWSFDDCSNLKSITILNPVCEIDNSSGIMSSSDGTIYGYSDSTTQDYAGLYGYKFESLGESPATKVIAGDANCDGKVSIADATAILQHLGNQDKYGLSAEGLQNADVDESDGVSTNDALVIQMVDAKILTVEQLPLR